MKRKDTVEDEVQSFLSKPPSKLVTYGSTVIIAIVALVISGGWLIQYPDNLVGAVVLNKQNGIVPLVSSQSGHVDSLFVSDGQNVHPGQLLYTIVENRGQSQRLSSIKSPIDGTISVNRGIFEKGSVNAGDLILHIKASDSIIVGNISTPNPESLKLRGNEDVKAIFNKYPADQFGSVSGRLFNGFYKAPRGGVHKAIVLFGGELKTSKNKLIKNSPGLEGKIEIATEGRSVVERVFHNLKNKLNELTI
jgi:hypothetical protein